MIHNRRFVTLFFAVVTTFSHLTATVATLRRGVCLFEKSNGPPPAGWWNSIDGHPNSSRCSVGTQQVAILALWAFPPGRETATQALQVPVQLQGGGIYEVDYSITCPFNSTDGPFTININN